MEQRTFRGPISPNEIAQILMARFNQGSFVARQLASGDRSIVQIGTRERGGHVANALAVTITRLPDGVDIALSQQAWLDAAADLAQAGLGALFNPLSILGNLGEIVGDVSSFSLPNQVWGTVEAYCKSVGASLGGSVAQATVTCQYCGVANPAGQPTCSACGASLSAVQPVYCKRCGQLLARGARFCSRCGSAVLAS